MISFIQNMLLTPCNGAYETVLMSLGFDAALPVQPESVVIWVSFCFYGLDLIAAIVTILVLCLYDVDKKMPAINAALLERRKQAVIASGREWVEPQEQERRERKALEEEHERNRVEDLKARCERKGLDFDSENEKYIKKQEEKRYRKQGKKKE